MATIKKFTDIAAWQRGRELVKEIYELTSVGKFSSDWGLKDQIRRVAVSICSNIAEGFERGGNKELVNFLWIAKGSAGEVSSQLYHAMDLGFVDSVKFDLMQKQLTLIGSMLYKLISSIKISQVKGVRFK
jgi:four helix bundle protein